MRTVTLFLSLLFFAPGALAQNTYKPWTNPDTSAAVIENRYQDLVKRLKELIEKAEQARAADPAFLKDLRDLTQPASPIAQPQILSDDFSDGNFERNPTWTVLAGEYWVEKGWGLRSAIAAKAQTSTHQSSQDAAALLFGKILNQALGGSQGAQQKAKPNEAIISTPVTISNAFHLQASLSSWTAEGRLELAVYQGKLSAGIQPAGYRLAYIPGGKLELIRVSARGSSIMNTATLAKPLEDKKFHAFEWLRQSDGRMTVRIDGVDILSATDLGFRDPFNGLVLINQGGDYILKQVEIRENR